MNIELFLDFVVLTGIGFIQSHINNNILHLGQILSTFYLKNFVMSSCNYRKSNNLRNSVVAAFVTSKCHGLVNNSYSMDVI